MYKGRSKSRGQSDRRNKLAGLDKISSTAVVCGMRTSRVKLALLLSLNIKANSIYVTKMLPHILETKSHDVVHSYLMSYDLTGTLR
jgi:hypothetical protein